MLSTMQDVPLTITHLLRRGQTVFSESEAVTYHGGEDRTRATFGEVGERVERLAAALRRLGVTGDERVGTFSWNHQQHLECYFAVPCMGAVLHTLNLRLFPEQLAFIVNHADDRVIVVDGSLIPLLAKVAGQLPNVRHFLVVGEGDHSLLGEAFPGTNVHDYEAALAAEEPGFAWPEIDERSAAAMCYTSGTTGNPKGVVYSHRSTFLHSMSVCQGGVLGLTERDRCLVIVPMFHANAWGTPYACLFAGCDLVLPKQFLQAEPLARLIALERPTVSAGVPTIWNDLYNYGETNPIDVSSLRWITAGGSAVPRVLMERFEEKYGLNIVQGWGMTETSPVAAIALPPKRADASEEMAYREMAGRVLGAVEVRVALEDGSIAPNDGQTVGEFEIRGPFITGSYYKDPSPEKFHDGWLRTGDMGTLDHRGFMRITDRTKDVIKSGGEWVSSIDLENEIMGHPAVLEAAVIGVPDPRWDERPLACVVLRPGATATVEELKSFLAERVAKWWIPERWTFIDAVPRTSVGKFDKKVLRGQYADGAIVDQS